MRKLSILFVALFTYTAQISAQNCLEFYPHEAGTKIETTSYEARGVKTGRSVQTVLEKSDKTIKFNVEAFDPKADTVIHSSNVSMKCEDGKWFMDMSGMLDGSTLSAYQNMEVVVDADQLEIPQNPSAGQKLNDGTVTATIKNQGFKILSITVDVTERIVGEKKSITTPAGTFDCYKISYNVKSAMGFVKVETKTVEWYSEKAGTVRSETYNKKDNLQSYSEITSIKK